MARELIYIIVLFLLPLVVFAQHETKGYVRNSENSEPIPFATIQIIGTTKGTVTNEDGYFILHYNFTNEDTVLISSLSFKNKKKFLSNQDSVAVFLEPESYMLTEIAIRPLNYEEIFYKLGRLLQIYRKNNQQSTSKVYFRLQTLSNDHPIELIEAFYNVKTEVNRGPTDFELKMGRFGQNKSKKFYNLNTTNQIESLNLFKKFGNSVFPKWCGNINLSHLEKFYKIQTYSETENGYNLKLMSKSKDLFDVEIDVNTSKNKIDQINLTSQDLKLNGYASIINTDSLNYENIVIEIKYFPEIDKINFISMKQDMKYFHHDFQPVIYKTKVDLVMIDYESLFINPEDFSTIDLQNDYSKIIAYGFDRDFWRSNNSIISTTTLAGQWDALSKSGDVAFFNSDSVSTEILKAIEYPLLKLDTTTQISWDNFGMNSSEFNIDKIYQKRIEGEYVRSNLYNLEFDYMVNPLVVNGKTKFYTNLFLDSSKSYFYIEKDSSILLSIDSIKNQILFKKNELFNSNYDWNLQTLSAKLSLFEVQLKKLSKQIYLFIPKTNSSTQYEKTDSAIVYYNIALAFQKAKDYSNSLDYYKKSIITLSKSNNNNELLKDILFNRASIWLEIGQTSKACEDLYQGKNLGDPQAKKRYTIVCKP